MDFLMLIIVLTVVVALMFDVINGFHDAANSIATVVSTRVLSPRIAVFWAAFFNFVAMFIFPAKVADTISKIVILTRRTMRFSMWFCARCSVRLCGTC
jgi:PiT family inorganic phosphate transporter